jgi:FkbM family methyltransferase
MKDKDRSKIKIGKTNSNFTTCVIDVGCADTGYRGKYYKDYFNVPCIYIDADQLSLENIQTAPEDLLILAAISSISGIGRFNIYQEYTHSLLDINFTEISKYIDGFTGNPASEKDWQKRMELFVPKLTLESIIESMKIKKVHALKIDTQGHDFEVVRGLGKFIKIVDLIELEVQLTEFELYKNQSSKKEILEYMDSWGFELANEEFQTFNQEQNLLFKNKELQIK